MMTWMTGNSLAQLALPLPGTQTRIGYQGKYFAQTRLKKYYDAFSAVNAKIIVKLRSKQ